MKKQIDCRGTLFLRPVTVPAELELFRKTGWYALRIELSLNVPFTIPPNMEGELVDSSWDKRGENFSVPEGGIVTLLKRGNAFSLALIEVELA